MKVFEGLNDAQRQAVAVRNGHVLVVAGPGTGKTLTIVRRISYLVDQGVPPDQILALTFSNRAAREMRERVRAFLGDELATRAFIGTFHLFGLRTLREIQSERRSVCTRTVQVNLIGAISGKGSKWAEQMADRISKIKNGAEIPDDETGQIYRVYEAALAQRNEWDFDDLIRIPVDLLRAGDTADRYRRYSHIVVDEYQDVSPMQYSLLWNLAQSSAANVWAVGDPDQAIYAFRGADIANFQNFQRDFAPFQLVVLKENYRSTQTVVRVSDSVIARNQERIGKELVATGEEGKPVTVISVPDERAEAEIIVREIELRMGGTSHYRIMSDQNSRDYAENTYGFSDFAVLFRTNAQASALRDALEAWGIPSQVVGRKDQTAVEALIETLKSRIDDLSDGADVVTLIALLSEETGIGQTDRMLLEGIAASYCHETPQIAILSVIDELTLLAAPDSYDGKADAVALMTIHAAKGLEFRIVFIAGCSEGLVPYVKVAEAPEIEEERRLFYVAMTRAKEELFILTPRRHFLYGQKTTRSESPFLSEIPKDYVRLVNIADPPRKPAKGKQQSLF